MIAVVDYDAGNIKSVEKALQYIGEKPVITRDISQIHQADKVIVPGVGAFEDAMGKMNRYHLTETLREVERRLWGFAWDCNFFLREVMSRSMMWRGLDCFRERL